MLLEVLVTKRNAQAIPVFLGHLGDDFEPARAAARQGLEVFGEEALPYVEKTLVGEDSDASVEAAKLIAEMPRSSAVRELMERSLGSVSNPEAVEILEAALQAGGDGPPEGLRALQILQKSYSYEDLQALEERLAGIDDAGEKIERVNALLESESWPIVALGEEYIQFMNDGGMNQPPFFAVFGPAMRTVKDRPFAPWFAAYMVSRFPTDQDHYRRSLRQRLRELSGIFGEPFATAVSYLLEVDDGVVAREPLAKWLEQQQPADRDDRSVVEVLRDTLGKRSVGTFAGKLLVALLETHPDGFPLYAGLYDLVPAERWDELLEGKKRRPGEAATERKVVEYLRKLSDEGVVAMVSTTRFVTAESDRAFRASGHRLLEVMADHEFGCALSHEAEEALKRGRELPEWTPERPLLNRE